MEQSAHIDKKQRSGNMIVLDIVIAVLAVCLVAAIGARLAGVQAFSVLTGSMEPNIPQGSLVVTVPCEINDVHEGDVVSFVLNEQLDVVTHRVVSVDRQEGMVTTRGDANNANDAPSLWGNVVGKVVFTVPGVGYAMMWLNSTSGRIIALTAVAVVVLLCCLIHVIRRPRIVEAHDVVDPGRGGDAS